jgi:chemotaxis protein MotB
MHGLIQQNLIVVRRKSTFLEIEIKTDILFASGAANISTTARPVILELGRILKPFDNALRVEGHTDDVPIANASFPSNWELSAARAASVVHVLLQAEVAPQRLSVSGMGEFHPAADNTTVQGRNANRRVVLVVLAGEGEGPDIEKVLGAQADIADPDAVQTASAVPPPLPLADGDPTVRLAP